MLVNTYVKLQMSVEIALPAFSSLYSVSDYYLSLKLRCFTRISGPEKSRNNTREKISYFVTCVDIANQLLTRHSPLTPLGQVDE